MNSNTELKTITKDTVKIEIPKKYEEIIKDCLQYLEETEHLGKYYGQNPRKLALKRLIKKEKIKDQLLENTNILYPCCIDTWGNFLEITTVLNWLSKEAFDFIYDVSMLHIFLNQAGYRRATDRGEVSLGYIYQWRILTPEDWKYRKKAMLDFYGKTHQEAKDNLIKKMNQYLRSNVYPSKNYG